MLTIWQSTLQLEPCMCGHLSWAHQLTCSLLGFPQLTQSIVSKLAVSWHRHEDSEAASVTPLVSKFGVFGPCLSRDLTFHLSGTI